MDDLIQIKGGKGAAPKLQDRELGYSKDENALYIGTENGNKIIGGNGIFYAVYGQTTVTDIRAALKAGKAIICSLNDGRYLSLTQKHNDGEFFDFAAMFPSDNSANLVCVTVSSTGWSAVTSQNLT